MTTGKRWGLALGLLLGLAAKPAHAGTNAYMDLKVTFTGQLSVAVDGAQFSTRTLAGGAGAHIVSSSATVTNDSIGLTEKWQLSVATVAGAGDWAVIASTGDGDCTNGGTGCPGTDEYSLQALFISSHTTATCPANADARWNTVTSGVTGSAQTYSSARYADATAVSSASGDPDSISGGADGNMLAAAGNGRGRRGMCTRLILPVGSTSSSEQVIRMTITAVVGG